MCGVFDEDHIPARNRFSQASHVTGMAGGMNGDHRANTGILGQGAGQGRGGKSEHHRVDIDEHRGGTEIANHFGRGGEGVVGGDHRIFGTNPVGFKRQMHGCSTRVDRNWEVSTYVVCECLFEGADFRAGGQPAAANAIAHFGDLFFTNRLSMKAKLDTTSR